MLTAMLLPLLVVSGPHPTPKMGLPLADPPIKVWLNDDRFERGDRAKVYVKADRDGYVLVLHAEPDGRVRVLFPLDPTDDDYIRAGETYEVRGRGDRNAFTVYDSRGEGVVFAAYSPDPFRFDEFVRSDHWDYRVDAFRVGDDAEADLTELAQQMAGQSEFQYDLVRYDVSQHVAYSGGYYPYYPYYYSGWYDPWYRPWRSGLFIGVSFGRPWYYSCWYCDPWSYDPWYYDPWYATRYYYTAWYRPYYYDAYWDPWYSPYRYYRRPSVIYTAFGNYYGNAYGWNGYRYAGQQRYGFNFVQPGRRTLSMFNPGPTAADARRRVIIPPTDIVPPANNVPRVRNGEAPGAGVATQAPGRRASPDTRQPAPRVTDQPRRVEPGGPTRPNRDPRGLVPARDARETVTPRSPSDRPRSIREVSPTERQPVTREPRQYTPSRPESNQRPQLERRSPERREPPMRAQPSEPRMREPRSSPPRSSSPPRMSSPPRSGGFSAPRAAPRGGGSGGRSVPSGGRRRG